jgi:hypothetical protein
MRNEIDCPRAQSWMTPCIARDGHTALADDGACVGCSATPRDLLNDLAGRWPEAATVSAVADPPALADHLTRCVAEYVEQRTP